MPVFGSGNEVPPEFEAESDFRWWKVHPRHTLVGVIISHDWTWYRGHYVNKRMHPCMGPKCKLCAKGVGAQIRWVVALAEPLARRVGLLEVGTTVKEEIQELAEIHGQLRGLPVEVTKHSFSERSRMEVRKIVEELGSFWAVLPVPDPKKALMLTWARLPGAADPDLEVPPEEDPHPRWSPPANTPAAER